MHSLQRVSRATRIKRMLGFQKKTLWNRIQLEYKLFAGYVMFLLLMFCLLSGCESGWTVLGWEVK